MDPESPRFVGGRRDNPTSPGTPHNNRLPDQVGATPQFDRHEEGIHVDMKNRPAPDVGTIRHNVIVRFSPAQGLSDLQAM